MLCPAFRDHFVLCKLILFHLFGCFNGNFSPNLLAVVGFTKLQAYHFRTLDDIFASSKMKRISFPVSRNLN